MLSSHTNPILSDFRDLHSTTGNPLWADAYLTSSQLIEDFEDYDRADWDHAMDVLIKTLKVFK